MSFAILRKLKLCMGHPVFSGRISAWVHSSPIWGWKWVHSSPICGFIPAPFGMQWVHSSPIWAHWAAAAFGALWLLLTWAAWPRLASFCITAIRRASVSATDRHCTFFSPTVFTFPQNSHFPQTPLSFSPSQ